MLVFIDTGVLLRLFDTPDPHYRTIRRMVRLLRAQGHKLLTAAQNVAEFWNVSTRPSSARGGYGISISRTDRRVRFIEHFGQILCESDATYVEWRKLILNYNVSGLAAHDARLAAIMRIAGISYIVTLNVSDFRRYPGITALTPQEVLAGAIPTP